MRIGARLAWARRVLVGADEGYAALAAHQNGTQFWQLSEWGRECVAAICGTAQTYVRSRTDETGFVD